MARAAPLAPSGRRRRALLAGGYALATFLAFPHPVAGRVLDLGLVASWLAPAFLLLATAGLPARRAARLGFAASLVAHTAVLHWIYVVTVSYGHAPLLAGLLAPVGLAAYIALFGAGFAAGSAWLAARGAGPFATAALWTALDHLRSFALTGFPWATLGYAQHENAALLALAPFAGVYALSFAVALGGAGLAELARGRLRRGAEALACVAALHALGLLLRAAEPPPEQGASVRVAVLQGNIDQGIKWSPAFAERTLAIYEDLTRRAAAQGAALVVWPETAVPGSPSLDASLLDRLAALARETRSALVVGAVGVERAASGPLYFDSAFVLEPSGRLAHRYDKSHLVPFGEYVPLRGWIGRTAKAVARGIAPDDVTAGAGPRRVDIAVGDSGATLPAGIPICYELLFPDLVRRFVAAGAGVLLAITNDAWYGRTGAPFQFLAITALRSAENRVWTARAANTGVSAVIDDRGRVRARTAIFERDFLVADIPLLPPPRGGTFYTRHGDVLAWACWIGAAGAGLVRRRRGGDGT